MPSGFRRAGVVGLALLMVGGLSLAWWWSRSAAPVAAVPRQAPPSLTPNVDPPAAPEAGLPAADSHVPVRADSTVQRQALALAPGSWWSRLGAGDPIVLDRGLRDRADGTDTVERVWLLETVSASRSHPYPYVRVVEQLAAAADGTWSVVAWEAMLADRVLVDLDHPAADPAALAAEFEALGLAAIDYRRGSHLVSVRVPELRLDGVPAALARLARSYRAEPDFLQFLARAPNEYQPDLHWQHEVTEAPGAWRVTTGGTPGPILAVIDSGADLEHPDLQPNLWANPGEIPGNNQDDDLNGFIDDTVGWDFVSDDNRPDDEITHGTHVTGIVGARGDNATGVFGVCWQARLIILRAGNETLPVSATSAAVDYLAALRQRGVPIVAVNNSYGSTSQSSTARNAIQRLTDTGVLFVAAVGNDGVSLDATPFFPALYPNSRIVAVAATNTADGRARFSNFSPTEADIAAPGVSIYSTLSPVSYGFRNGTSMAAPLVTGALGLLSSTQGSLNPDELRQRLLGSADRVPALVGSVVDGARLNLRRLVDPTLGLPVARWVEPAADLVVLDSTALSLDLRAEGSQERDGIFIGALPVSFSSAGPGASINLVTFESLPGGLTRARFPAPGIYRVRATTTLGTLTSTAERTVAVGVSEPSATGLRADWRFEEAGGTTALDSSGSNTVATLNPFARRESGRFGQALALNGSTSAATFAQPSLSPSVTVSAWVRPTTAGNSIFPRVVHAPDYYLFLGRSPSEDANDQTIKFFVERGPPATSGGAEPDGIWHSPNLSGGANGVWQHLAVTYSAGDATRLPRFFIDGRPRIAGTQVTPAGAPQSNAGSTAFLGENGQGTRAFDGLIDEVRLYDRELDPGEVRVLAEGPPSLAEALGLRLVAQAVSGQPLQVRLLLVTAAGLPPTMPFTSRTASISGPGLPSVGAFSDGSFPATLTVSGSHTVDVRLATGSLEVRRRFVLDLPGQAVAPVAPTFRTQPEDRAVRLGNRVQWSADVEGTPPFTFQWLYEGDPIFGETGPTYSLDAVRTGDAGRYAVRVTNAAGTVRSRDAVLSVLLPPDILRQPEGLRLRDGVRAELSVEVTGTPPFSYQWSRDGTPLAGATSAVFPIEVADPGDQGTYTVFVTNAVGSVTSAPAEVVVLQPPAIIQGPLPQRVPLGRAVEFRVTVNGTAPLTYRWFKDGRLVAGADAEQLAISAAQETDAGVYSVEVSNEVGTATAGDATLTVVVPAGIVRGPEATTVIAGQPLELSVEVRGTPPFSFLWHRDGLPIAGATSATYRKTVAEERDAGTYRVLISNELVNLFSPEAVVTVLTPPYFTREPTSLEVDAGTVAELVATAEGSPPLTFQWRRNQQPLPGATAATLRLSPVRAEDAGVYDVVVSGPGGSRTSAQAVVTVRTLPVVTAAPRSLTVVEGSEAVFRVSATGAAPLTYQWRRNAVPLPGATATELRVAAATSAEVGSYDVVVTNALGSVTSPAAFLSVQPVVRLANLSTRALVGTGSEVLIGGWVVGGTGPRRFLIRGVGPSLAGFGVEGTLADPALRVFRAGQTPELVANGDWGASADAAALRSEAARVGAFALLEGSRDAALLVTLDPGAYTVELSGVDGSTGVALIEAYDVGAAGGARLVNLSARARVGTGEAVAIPGLVVTGNGSRTFLIRAVGPGLTAFGVPGALADPRLRVLRGTAPVLDNDQWHDPVPAAWEPVSGGKAAVVAAVREATARTGAFALAEGSLDAALLVVLGPGSYTALVEGADGGTGIALVEIYEVP